MNFAHPFQVTTHTAMSASHGKSLWSNDTRGRRVQPEASSLLMNRICQQLIADLAANDCTAGMTCTIRFCLQCQLICEEDAGGRGPEADLLTENVEHRKSCLNCDREQHHGFSKPEQQQPTPTSTSPAECIAAGLCSSRLHCEKLVNK